MDETIKQHLEAVIAYCWEDELADYQENQSEGHVFCSLLALDNFINGANLKPSDFVQPNAWDRFNNRMGP